MGVLEIAVFSIRKLSCVQAVYDVFIMIESNPSIIGIDR